jgi:hypothetical protein
MNSPYSHAGDILSIDSFKILFYYYMNRVVSWLRDTHEWGCIVCHAALQQLQCIAVNLNSMEFKSHENEIHSQFDFQPWM